MINKYTTGKCYGIFGKHNQNTRIWHFDFAGNGLASTTNKYDATFTSSKNCDLQCPKLKIHNKLYMNASFIDALPKIPHNCQGIHHPIVNV